MSKKTHLKEMCDFLTLKMLPLALALIKTNNRHLFYPLVRKCSFYMRIYRFWRLERIFHWNGQFLTNGSKIWQFLVFINARANGNIFRFKKSHISLRCVFLRHPVYSHVHAFDDFHVNLGLFTKFQQLSEFMFDFISLVVVCW